MARMIRTARKRTTPRSSPASIIWEYQTYAQCYGDDLGEFLAHFRRLWLNAHRHGVTGYDGIIRLISLLPLDWQGWATEISGDFLFRQGGHYDLMGDFPHFIASIHYCYDAYGQAPRGPYQRPGDYVPVGMTQGPDAPPHPPLIPPVVASHSINQIGYTPASILGRRGRNDFEAGPSRPPAETKPRSPPKALPAQSTSSDSIGTSTMDRLVKITQERTRKGKAPVQPKVPKEKTPQPPPVGTAEKKARTMPSTIQPLSPDPDVFYGEMKRHIGELKGLWTTFNDIWGSETGRVPNAQEDSEEESEEDPEEDPEENPKEKDPEKPAKKDGSTSSTAWSKVLS